MKESKRRESTSIKMKRFYIPPGIEAIGVELESCIASGSATAVPSDTNAGSHTWDNAELTLEGNDSPIYW